LLNELLPPKVIVPKEEELRLLDQDFLEFLRKSEKWKEFLRYWLCQAA